MRYVIDTDDAKVWPEGVGVPLDKDAAVLVARVIAELFNVAEGIPLQDPPEPVYRAFPSGSVVDPTAWEDEPPSHDSLTRPARPA